MNVCVFVWDEWNYPVTVNHLLPLSQLPWLSKGNPHSLYWKNNLSINLIHIIYQLHSQKSSFLHRTNPIYFLISDNVNRNFIWYCCISKHIFLWFTLLFDLESREMCSYKIQYSLEGKSLTLEAPHTSIDTTTMLNSNNKMLISAL